jgi:hypothetical protein
MVAHLFFMTLDSLNMTPACARALKSIALARPPFSCQPFGPGPLLFRWYSVAALCRHSSGAADGMLLWIVAAPAASSAPVPHRDTVGRSFLARALPDNGAGLSCIVGHHVTASAPFK